MTGVKVPPEMWPSPQVITAVVGCLGGRIGIIEAPIVVVAAIGMLTLAETWLGIGVRTAPLTVAVLLIMVVLRLLSVTLMPIMKLPAVA